MSTASGERRRLGVRVLTPEGAVHIGEAAMVIAPSVEGEVGILPRHMPLVAALRPGETRLKLLDDTDLILATTAGYMSVEDDVVVIIVEQAEDAAHIDRSRAEAALRRAEEDLAAVGDDDEAGDRARSALRRAENRLKVVDRDRS